MSLPSTVGLPDECKLGSLPYSLPPDAKSMSVKVLPSNLQSVVSTITPPLGPSVFAGDLNTPSTNIIFDVPCGASPSQFLDTRLSTLNFQMTITCTNAGTLGSFAPSYLRGGAASFFDRLYVTSQSGQVLEDISEYGMVFDTLANLQFNNSVKKGVATMYGFDGDATRTNSQNGHFLQIISSTTPPLQGNAETHSYSIPLLSGVLGVLNDKMLNIGRTSRLQCILSTANILPITIQVGSTAFTGAPQFTVTLSNFSLQLEYVDIGMSALQILDESLVDGKAYSHGVTYRTVTANLPAQVTGFQSLLAGIRASSVKSLFTRFSQQGAVTNYNYHGKYSSFNPLVNSINYNFGGLKMPQAPVNPLLLPSQAMADVQRAAGAYNNTQYQSAILPSQYCRLSQGGAAQSLGVAATQEFSWNQTTETPAQQSLFMYGYDCEVVSRRGLLSGINATSAPIFVEMNITGAGPTNPHTVYVIGMLDQILCHDCVSGDISVRL